MSRDMDLNYILRVIKCKVSQNGPDKTISGISSLTRVIGTVYIEFTVSV